MSSRTRDEYSNAYNETVCIGFYMPMPEVPKDGYGGATQ